MTTARELSSSGREESHLKNDKNEVCRPWRSKPTLFRRYTFQEVTTITPTKEGGKTRLTVAQMTLDDGFGHDPSSRSVAQVFMSRMSCFSNTSSSQMQQPPTKRCKTDSIQLPLKESLTREHKTKKISRRNVKQKWGKSHLSLLLHIIWPSTLFLTLGFLMISGIAHVEVTDSTLNLSNARHLLAGKVFGQKKALETLLDYLEGPILKDLKDFQPVIVITGGIGVGKTLTLSIISESFPKPGQSQYFVFPHLPTYEAVLHRFNHMGPHMLVIDNVNPQESSVIHWVKLFQTAASVQGKLTWIILIYNVQEWDKNLAALDDSVFSETLETQGNLLITELKLSGLNLSHIHFLSLGKDVVRKCVQEALRERDAEKYVTDTFIENIVTADQHQGCKRVWSRVLAVNVSGGHL